MLYRTIRSLAATASIVAGVLASSAAYAETRLVVGYQQIVGPFVAAIADGRFDAAAKEAGYAIDWRQFSSAGDITTALASGDVPIGVIGSTGTASAATRGVELQLFWVLDNIGKSEALVARDGSGIETPACVSAWNIGSDAFLMTISFTLRRSTVPEEDPAWHAHTFAF